MISNFHDVLVAAYDQDILKEQIAAAIKATAAPESISQQQRLNLDMSIRNLIESLETGSGLPRSKVSLTT